MQGYVAPLKRLTRGNDDFRHVLFSTGKMQLVLMSLKPGEAIGAEVHATHDQFLRIEKGKGRLKLGHARIVVSAGDAIMVPAGQSHNLTNTGKRRMRLYTLYAPPNHPSGLIEPTRAIAEAHEASRSAASQAEQGRKDMIDEGSPVGR